MINNLLILNEKSSETFKELVNFLKNSETEYFYCDYNDSMNDIIYLFTEYLKEKKLNNIINVSLFNYKNTNNLISKYDKVKKTDNYEITYITQDNSKEILDDINYLNYLFNSTNNYVLDVMNLFFSVNYNTKSLINYYISTGIYSLYDYEYEYSNDNIQKFNLYSDDISNNGVLNSSVIYVKLQLTTSLKNNYDIQQSDISCNNGVIDHFSKIDDINYGFYFIPLTHDKICKIYLIDNVNFLNLDTTTVFKCTFLADPLEFTFTSKDVDNGGIVKNNKIELKLTFNKNSKIILNKLNKNNFYLKNCIILEFKIINLFEYIIKVRSLSSYVKTVINLSNYIYSYDMNNPYFGYYHNMDKEYNDLKNSFEWMYECLDILSINNKKIAVIEKNNDVRELDVIINGNVDYNSLYNEYYFDGNPFNNLSISGEIFTDEDYGAISFWYKTENINNWGTIITIRNKLLGNNPYQDCITISNNNNNKLIFKIKGLNTINNVTSIIPYESGVYSHVLISFTKNDIKIYKNGKLIQLKNIKNVINSGIRKYQYVGAGFRDGKKLKYGFNGFIKNIRFFNREISEEEVNGLYNMYNAGLNDTVKQIESIKLYSTTNHNNNIFTNTVIEMVMEIKYDNISEISTIENENFLIDENNFDISLCYLYNIKKINNNKILFNIEPKSLSKELNVSVIEDSILRNIDNRLNFKSNPSSNLFYCKYEDLSLNVTKIYSDNVKYNSYTNEDIISISIQFSDNVFNFTKKYIKCDNCKIINIVKNDIGYNVNVKTYYNTKASIKIVNDFINVGLYNKKYIENNIDFTWNYYNIDPILSIKSSHKNNDINNNNYLDINLNILTPINNFESSDIIINGRAYISSFKGSESNYDIRIIPENPGNIIIKFCIRDIYENKNMAKTEFIWFYDNIAPNINSVYINKKYIQFLFNKQLYDFNCSNIKVNNGKIFNLKEIGIYPKNKIRYMVTVRPRIKTNEKNKSTECYYLNGEECPILTFYPKTTYIFDQSDITNKNHKINFYKDVDKKIPYTDFDNILIEVDKIMIYINNDFPFNLYYNSENEFYMGNIITKGSIYECELDSKSSSVDVIINKNTIKDKYNNMNEEELYYNISI